MHKVVQDGEDNVLREPAQEVPQDLFNTPKLEKMLADMKAALEPLPHGVALAGPQIAIPYRIFIVRYDRMTADVEEDEGKEPDVGVYINPKIIKTSRRKVPVPEGCLSVDGVFGTTQRHERTTVEAQDEHGKIFTRGAGGILAQAFQHEIEHLDGILFIDHAENLKKHEES